LPPREEVLKTFKETDFEQLVYLEDFDEPAMEQERSRKRQAAVIRAYSPNRIRVDVDTVAPDFLVLTDVWFPGWKCTVRGEEAKVYRANYTFRAVKVPAGRYKVEFRFEPRSYLLGRVITLVCLVAVAGIGSFLVLRSRTARTSDGNHAPGEGWRR
jgi:uncharacterized membrane protein YfhO